MLIGLMCGLGTLFVLLTWVGWRFFIAPARHDNIAAPASVAVAPVVAVPAPVMPEERVAEAVLPPPKNLEFERKREPRPKIAWFKIFSHWSIWLIPLLIGLPIVAVLALSGHIPQDPLEVLDFDWQSHIDFVLNTEKLVPPPVLPPSMFINAERPELVTADRDWSRLDPVFTQKALRVFAQMAKRGFPLALLEGYRSPQRQDDLANMGTHVTNARAFQSKHQYGLALDAAPMRDGKIVISERDPWAMQAYQALGEEAEREGLIWGGRWKLQDYGHIESSESIRSLMANRPNQASK